MFDLYLPGLSIAGDGGVASSKPIGTAIAGASGLAVARPVATAIAGVKPDEIPGIGYQETPYNKKVTTSKTSSSLPLGSYSYKLGANGVLIGPNADSQIQIQEINKMKKIITENRSEVDKVENREKSDEKPVLNEKGNEPYENNKDSTLFKDIRIPGFLGGNKIPIEYFNYYGTPILNPSTGNIQSFNPLPLSSGKNSQFPGIIFV